MKAAHLLIIIFFTLLSPLVVSDVCIDSHAEFAKNSFSAIQQFEELDLNNDGINELIYYGDCGPRNCASEILQLQKGCYQKIFRGSSEIQFIDSIPEEIKENFKSVRNLKPKYKVLLENSSNCVGYIRVNSVYLFHEGDNEYVNIYRNTVDLCKFR